MQLLLLEGEGRSDLTEEQAAEVEGELRENYGRRKLATNVDRSKEEEIDETLSSTRMVCLF
jgi:hypothetical protein